MKFSATDAAFEGFRLVRRNPMALIAWTLLYLAVTLAQIGAMGRMGSGIAEMERVGEAMEANPPQTFQDLMPIFQAYGEMMSGMSWIMPLSLLVSVVLSAAVARGVIFPKAGGAFGYLRISMDEVRVAVVTLVIAILTGLISVVAFLGAGIAGGVAVATLEGWGWLVTVLLMIAAVCFIVWLAVRWSLAVPITIAEKRIALFDSFRMTKGRFWSLLGMAILAGVMAAVVWLLSLVVSGPINIMSGLGMAGMDADDPAAVFAAFSYNNPWVIASAVVNAVIGALTVGVIYAPFSAAYLALSGKGQSADDAR